MITKYVTVICKCIKKAFSNINIYLGNCKLHKLFTLSLKITFVTTKGIKVLLTYKYVI